MKIFHSEIPMRLNGLEHGTFDSFGNYFRQKAVQLMLITLICVALFFLSGLVNKGVDKLKSIAPTTIKQLNADD